MVVYKNAPPKPIVEPDDVRKERLLAEMRKRSVDLITLALVYADNFELTTTDVTKRWETTKMQTDALQAAYNKGFSDGVERERQKADEVKLQGIKSKAD